MQDNKNQPKEKVRDDKDAKKPTKGKGGRYGKGNRKFREDKQGSEPSFTPGNDFSWWNKNPELTVSAANFKSNYIAGTPISLNVNYVVPGILQIGLATCYYPSCTATDPVNVWARDLYLRMFQKYRPASSYSASDLGITIMAALEAVKLIAMYERIYGIINRYSILNLNMPLNEAQSLGLSAAQVTYLQGHLSDFRYDLNYLIRKAQRLCIPKDISFVADAISLLGYEYIDHNNPRGQLILFTLKNVGIYDDIGMTSGGSIQYDTLGLSQDHEIFDFTADNMCVALDDVLTALLGSDSVQRICADLFVWFGEAAMLQFLPIPEDYTVVPTVSESIMHKIHNAVIHPSANNTSGTTVGTSMTSWAKSGLSTADENFVLNGKYHVYQYNDDIVTVCRFKDTNAGTVSSVAFKGVTGKGLGGTSSLYSMPANAQIIDGYEQEPGPDFVIEGSLFKFVPSTYQGQGIFILSCVNWLLTEFNLWTANSATPTLVNNVAGANVIQYAGRLALVDWAPLTYNIQAGVIQGIFGDLDVIIPVSDTELDRIHRTCFLSGIKTDVTPIRS